MGRMLAEQARLIGRGSIQARLYIVHEIDAQGPNSYPAAVPSAFADDRVYGEVHEITGPTAPLFAAVNDYEFMLRDIDVAMEDGTTVTAGCYLYTWDTSRADPVPSGRFTGSAAGTR
jgi:gamma-glutamylcyclotransferase (GGCT)/AIG2-like uncharacterized protein YtfP